MTLDPSPENRRPPAWAREGAPEPVVDAEADSAPSPSPTATLGRGGSVVLAISLVLIAFNLRPVFSSLSVVLPEIMRDTGMSTGMASLLTTLPVVCLGLFAPLAAGLAMRVGAERVILVLLCLLGLGTALRGLATVPALLVGSALAGASIAIVNVLLPGLVKRDFPQRAAAMTGLYTMALCGGAAAGAGLTVPLEHLTGEWGLALALWAVPAVVVAAAFAPQALATRRGPRRRAFRVRGLWTDPLAWQVTLFMGLQSALAYCVFGWLARSCASAVSIPSRRASWCRCRSASRPSPASSCPRSRCAGATSAPSTWS